MRTTRFEQRIIAIWILIVLGIPVWAQMPTATQQSTDIINHWLLTWAALKAAFNYCCGGGW